MILKASTATSEANVTDNHWPQDIPRNYDELEKMYGGFIVSTLRRHNKVKWNFVELYSHVWMRLVEVDVIDKFMLSVSMKQPPTMTTLEACTFFGVSYSQWKSKMCAWHVGIPVRNRSGQIICRRAGGWMPTPCNRENFKKYKNSGLYSIHAIFETSDIMYLSSKERQKSDGTIVGPFNKQAPELNIPKLEATKKHFQAYLKTAIYSNFLNWCRTYRRRFAKDRPMELDEAESEQSGRPSWEQNLVDPTRVTQETVATLREAVTRLSTTLYTSMEGVPSCKPVSEYETEMLKMLMAGRPLPDVVKRLKLPDRVRRAILQSVSEMTPPQAA